MSSIRLAAALVALGGLGGCGTGASESEFVQACRTGPQEHTTEATCSCAAHEARSRLSAAQFHAMVLDMQGKRQEAEASLGDMSFEQRAAFAQQQFEILGKCLTEK